MQAHMTCRMQVRQRISIPLGYPRAGYLSGYDMSCTLPGSKRWAPKRNVVQRKRNNDQGETLPQEMFSRSRVSQLLWAYRGRRQGTSLTDLCAQGPRTEFQIRAQIAAARKYLRRVGSCWEILSEDRETETGELETYFWLVAPHCPRPTPRQVPELQEPEFISFDEIESEFPVLPRWEIGT